MQELKGLRTQKVKNQYLSQPVNTTWE